MKLILISIFYFILPSMVFSQKDSTEIFTFLTYGFSTEEKAKYSVADKWNINYKFIGGCEVSVELEDSIKKQNNITREKLVKRYGNNWEDRFNKEVHTLSLKLNNEEELGREVLKNMNDTKVKRVSTEMFENYTLYIGHPNKVRINVANSTKPFFVKGHNCIVKFASDSSCYIVYPNRERDNDVYIHVYERDEYKNVTSLDTVRFYVDVCKVPEIMIDDKTSNSFLDKNSDFQLELNFDKRVRSERNSKIVSWKIETPKGNCSGTGLKMEELKKLCLSFNTTTKLKLSVYVEGQDGLIRRLSKIFTYRVF